MKTIKRKSVHVPRGFKRKLEPGQLLTLSDVYGGIDQPIIIKEWLADAQKNIWGEYVRPAKCELADGSGRLIVDFLYTPKGE